MTPDDIIIGLRQSIEYGAARQGPGALHVSRSFIATSFHAQDRPSVLSTWIKKLADDAPMAFLPVTVERHADGGIDVHTAGIPLKGAGDDIPALSRRACDLLSLEDALEALGHAGPEPEAFWVTVNGKIQSVGGLTTLHGRSGVELAGKLAIAIGISIEDEGLAPAIEMMRDTVDGTGIGLSTMADWMRFDLDAAIRDALNDLRALEDGMHSPDPC